MLVAAIILAVLLFVALGAFAYFYVVAANEKVGAQAQNAFFKAEVERLTLENGTLTEKLAAAEKQNLLLSQKDAILTQKQLEWENNFKMASEQMKSDFRLLSIKIFEDAQKKLAGENSENIAQILNPLKSDLTAFSKRVEELNGVSREKQANFETQIKYLGELNTKLSQDAKDLTNALKNNKTAGNWGELVLERLLELSGLQEGIEYKKQVSVKSETGAVLRPDIIVSLTNNRTIVIDSKLSLDSFEKCVKAESPAAYEEAVKSFKISVERHIKGLSQKKYEDLFKTPDFVFVFVPIEGAFSLIMKECPEIYETAYESKIVLAGPSTLLASLKTVEFIWRAEKQEKHSMEIAEMGAKLYEKMRIFCEKYMRLGEQIKTVSSTYEESLKTISQGKGNALSIADKMVALGVKTKSEIKMDFEKDA